MQNVTIDNSKERVLHLCYGIAGNRRIVAACLYGAALTGYEKEKIDINVLLVLRTFGSQIRTYKKQIDSRNTLILAIDQGAFQRDVSAGWLGEVAADKLLTPYESLINDDYLWRQEVVLKRRVTWELLESVVLEFPELSRELSIRPEYFMYETQLERAKLFSPIVYRFLNMMRNDVKEKNVNLIMKGYVKALEELSGENWVTFADGLVKITPQFIDAIKSRKIRIPTFLRSFQRAAFRHIFSALPKMMAPLSAEEEVYNRTYAGVENTEDLALQLEDSKNHIFMPTPLGPVPLSDATTIEDFVRKSVPRAGAFPVKIREIGGVLNSVYLLTMRKDHQEQKIVVKKFKDWTGFKWYPLALWSLGTKSFALLGKSRLEREYALNQFLQTKGLTVPKVLYISPKQSLVFQEFVEGTTLAEAIKKMVSTNGNMQRELELIRDAGRKIALAHQEGVGLGDCKPENIIITKEGKLCFIDLEQASRDGNHPWDIAEFLYYSGHYVPPLATTEKIEHITTAFIDGYLEAGGNAEAVKKAASPRYTKVFSIFTQPHVLLAISSLCRKVGRK
jgi:tRNA A-37 threonylcarbamoyl transferase component Bud32